MRALTSHRKAWSRAVIHSSSSSRRPASRRSGWSGEVASKARNQSGASVTELGPIYLTFVNGYHPTWAEALAHRLASCLPREVELLDLDLDLDSSFSEDRGQHEATLLIAQLLRRLPDSAGKIVGITSIDLFSPVLTFVFGQSQLDGPGAIVSTHRLRNEYYGLPCDEELMFQRTLKEVLHELGHAFGLIHCADFRCVMSASSHVGEVDLKRAWYCPQCQTVLTVGHWQ